MGPQRGPDVGEPRSGPRAARERAVRTEVFDTVLVVAAVDWNEIFVQAVRIALAIVRTESDAEDIVMNGVELVMSGKAPHDPAQGTSLPRHVVGVGSKVWRRAQAKVRRRQAPAFVAMMTEHDPPEANLEDDYADRQHRAWLFRQLSAACADDPEEMLVLEAESK